MKTMPCSNSINNFKTMAAAELWTQRRAPKRWILCSCTDYTATEMVLVEVQAALASWWPCSLQQSTGTFWVSLWFLINEMETISASQAVERTESNDRWNSPGLTTKHLAGGSQSWPCSRTTCEPVKNAEKMQMLADPGAPVRSISKLWQLSCTARIKEQCTIMQKILSIETSS